MYLCFKVGTTSSFRGQGQVDLGLLKVGAVRQTFRVWVSFEMIRSVLYLHITVTESGAALATLDPSVLRTKESNTLIWRKSHEQNQTFFLIFMNRRTLTILS